MITESEKNDISTLKEQSKKIADQIEGIQNLELRIQNIREIKELGISDIKIEVTSKTGYNSRAIESTYRNLPTTIDSKILDLLIEHYESVQRQKIHDLSGYQVVNLNGF